MLYTLGKHQGFGTHFNTYEGQLGVTFDNIKPINLINDKILFNKISAGRKHFGCINDKYELYMLGSNIYGQSALKDDYIFNLTKVGIQYKVYDIKCGGNHTIIKSKNKYYSFGRNKNGQCLLKTPKQLIFKPSEISLDFIKKKIGSNKPIINIIPGIDTNFILQSCV